jgi:putative ABC transport system permease protein
MLLTNYSKIIFRNLQKNSLFSSISILGMAISLASCILIALYVSDELSYDKHYPTGDRTFRLYNIRSGDDGVTNYLPIVPNTFGPYMQKDFPEIESTMRMMDTYGEVLFEKDNKKFMEEGGVYAEPNIFDMLSINVVSGDAQTALADLNVIALSQPLAQKYFGDVNPVGETINFSNKPFKVTAVFESLPEHGHLSLSYIVSFATLSQNWNEQRRENWIWQQFFTYVRLKPNTSATALQAKFPGFIEKYAKAKTTADGFTYMPYLQNIQDIYLHSSHFEWEIARRGNIQTVYVLSGSALLILLIACLNFINLSTARSLKRMKEVGVRKIAGAGRKQLIVQFIGESLFITLLGLVAAVVICEITLPYLNDFTGKNIALPVTWSVVSFMVLFTLVIGVIAGSYPAFHLSGFQPAVLYNKSGHKGSTLSYLREGLVIVQFMFAFFLITSSMIVLSQNNLLRNKDLGFQREQLVSIELHKNSLKQYETTKREFLNHPNVVSATVGYGLPGDIVAGDGVTDPRSGKNWPANLFLVDHDYITTMQMKLVAGRDFSRDFTADSTERFIINETAAKTYGFESSEKAVGQLLQWGEWSDQGKKRVGEIIGVVKDFHFKSLREQMTPVVMTMYPDAYWKITLRVKPEDISTTLAHLKTTYERLEPEWPFRYRFMDESFNSMYKGEEKLSTLFSIFTGLAIFVSCLGLFGLVEYSVNQRTREISIRKVLGASTNSLLVLLTRKYFLLILIAFSIVIPLNYYSAGEWLNTFAYHITIQPWVYVKAGALIILITLITVSIQSMKAAWANPVDSLRGD